MGVEERHDGRTTSAGFPMSNVHFRRGEAEEEAELDRDYDCDYYNHWILNHGLEVVEGVVVLALTSFRSQILHRSALRIQQ